MHDCFRVQNFKKPILWFSVIYNGISRLKDTCRCNSTLSVLQNHAVYHVPWINFPKHKFQINLSHNCCFVRQHTASGLLHIMAVGIHTVCTLLCPVPPLWFQWSTSFYPQKYTTQNRRHFSKRRHRYFGCRSCKPPCAASTSLAVSVGFSFFFLTAFGCTAWSSESAMSIFG